jgi:hypothetical protein
VKGFMVVLPVLPPLGRLVGVRIWMGCVPRPTSRTDLYAALPRPKRLIQFRPGPGGVSRVGHGRAWRSKISDPTAPC